MEDGTIIDLYWQRSDRAIDETGKKYGKYCYKISYNILANREDCEECINDTYVKLWNILPPQTPNSFSAFIAKIVRNISLNLYRFYRADKRGSGEVALLLDELAECVTDGSTLEGEIEKKHEQESISKALNEFLRTLDMEVRNIFIRRYFHAESIKELSTNYSMTESRIKSLLFRNRKKLKVFLEKEGIVL